MEEFENVKLSKTAKIKASWMIKLLKEINTTPSLYLKARAIHGCVLCEKDNVKVYMEEVGRHNAVDKIVGYLHLEDLLPANNLGLWVSGRASFEMVQKAVMAGSPCIVAIGAPTTLAIELARQHGITLIGFARDCRFNVYTGAWRLEE